jgi:Ca-activated chloride channel family protein
VAAALAGTSDALRSSDISPAALTSFFSGQALTAGSSGFLSDAYVRSQDSQADLPPAAAGGSAHSPGRFGPVAGMINYESVLLSLNASGKLREPLTLVYPKDGIVTADYPLMLLRPDKRALYQRAVSWLRLPATQRRLEADTARRPAVPGVPLDLRFPGATLTELPFPASEQVANDLLAAYLDKFRRPTHAIFLLDVSGSMAGARLAALKAALRGLSGTDQSLSGQFTRFRAREKITIVTFASRVYDNRDFTVDDPSPGSPGLKAVDDFVDHLQVRDATAIYSALDAGYEAAGAALAADPSYLTSIVLMTDGENNAGASPESFEAYYRGLRPAARGVRTFTIGFGDADLSVLRRISDETGGALFDARTGSLSDVFKDIRGYQ